MKALDKLIAERDEDEYQEVRNQMASMLLTQPDKPVAYLLHEPTHTNIAVYQKMNWFQRLMIRWCFGLKYRKI